MQQLSSLRVVVFSAASHINPVINHIEMYTESISEYCYIYGDARNKMVALHYMTFYCSGPIK